MGSRKSSTPRSCRCFCPIGKADYTNNFTVTITPKKWIPDYCEIDKFIREQLDGKSLVIEDAACKLKQWLTGRFTLLGRGRVGCDRRCARPCNGNGIREGRKMKNTRALCQTAVVAALYVGIDHLEPPGRGAQSNSGLQICSVRSRSKTRDMPRRFCWESQSQTQPARLDLSMWLLA